MSTLTSMFRQLERDWDLTRREGYVATPLHGVRLFRAEGPVARAPLLYEAGIVIIGQGHKIGYLDGRRFRYDVDHYLILSVPLPFECETHASPQAPLLGMFIDVDLTRLQQLIATIGEQLPDAGSSSDALACGVEPAPLDDAMAEVVTRLLRCLLRPLDTRVLGPAIVNELVYRALLGPHGAALSALTHHHTPYARIARALAFIHHHYAEAVSIDQLAHEASMSASAFHRAFKRVTGESPLQYIKKVRLNKARSLLVHEGLGVSAVAYEVGYESPSHFSREFKRYFSASPSQARATGYGRMLAGTESAGEQRVARPEP